MWRGLGLLGFFLFRRTASQMAGAIDSNRALFSYRQVKPTDTVLMRGVLEGLLMAMVITIVGAGMALLGHNVMPADPMRVLAAFFGMRSEEHTSELQQLMRTSYAAFCIRKKKTTN